MPSFESSGASSAGPSSSSPLRTPVTPPIAPGKRTTSARVLRDPRQHTGSPPTTPSPRARQRVPQKGKQSVRVLGDRGDGHSGQHHGAISTTPKHSHELSWSSTTRDSLVDNLLFSLDSFSRGSVDDPADTTRPHELEWRKYDFSDVPPFFASTTSALPRSRSHTLSSSVSTNLDLPIMSDSTSVRSGSTVGPGSTSDRHSRLQRTTSKTFSRAESSRASTDTQRPNPITSTSEGDAKSKISIDAQSVDWESSGSPTKARPTWKRRSVSLDQLYADAGMTMTSILSRGRPVPSIYSTYESDRDAAPEPNIANGPRTLLNPDASGPVYVGQAPSRSALRKTTTQADLRSASSSNLNGAAARSAQNQSNHLLRSSNMRDTLTPQTLSGNASSASSPTFQSVGQKSRPSASRERPGFFRRVFGGASTRGASNSPKSGDSGGPAGSQTVPPRTSSSGGTRNKYEVRRNSKEEPAGTSYPPISLNKKPSSFFRRRKKSNSENTPVPPLPVNSNLAVQVNKVEPSPSISSLRKVMDPYLDGANDERAQQPFRPTTGGSSASDSESLDIFHSGYTPRAEPPSTYVSSLSRSPISPPRSSSIQASSPTDEGRGRNLPGAGSKILAHEEKASLTLGRPVISETDSTARSGSTGGRTTNLKAGISTDDLGAEIEDTLHSVLVGGFGTTLASDGHERPYSKNLEQVFLQPSGSEERLSHEAHGATNLSPLIESHSRNTSVASASGAPGGAAPFVSALASPITPSTGYHSATSLPLPTVQVGGDAIELLGEANGGPQSPAIADGDVECRERAQKIFDGEEEGISKMGAASWLGEDNPISARTRQAYMSFFDFSGLHILAGLRLLCGRLILRGETQQFDRIITALSERWCKCNPNHGFKTVDVVHTILYSLILLNTDLHLADISEKMSRSAYVKNTLPTIRRVAFDNSAAAEETIRPPAQPTRPTLPWTDPNNPTANGSDITAPGTGSERNSLDSNNNRVQASKRLSIRPSFPRNDSDNQESNVPDSLNTLVSQPCHGSKKTWELEIEAALKAFYTSIKYDPLPLFRPSVGEHNQYERSNSAGGMNGMLRRTGSIISKAPSDTTSFRSKPGLRTMTMGLQGKYNRSKPKIYPASTLGSSSRTSFDDGNSVWSPAQSSKYSFSKTLTSASMQSLGQHYGPSIGDFKHSIGFANALSQAIIREEAAVNRDGAEDSDSISITVPHGLLDEALALAGAPWAKEGLVKHKHHLEAEGKRAKERSWNDCFAVISTGKLTLFAFNTSSKSQSYGRKTLSRPSTARASSLAAPRVGGGDWMENAEQLDVFILRQTIASTLPSPGYSKTRPHVWALSLPSGAVHLFQVGTPEIAQEFMSTANYWSARLSKEPLSGGVSNIEYGWGDEIVNTAVLDRTNSDAVRSPAYPPSSMQQSRSANHIHTNSATSRPSFQSSVRGSLDAGFGSRARLPGDKLQLAEWHPPTQSMMPSQLMEVDQLRALTAYVSLQEEELEKHNELKHAIELAYTPRHTNFSRALANWQRKSDYLLREIVKFRTYIDSLTAAQTAKEGFYVRKADREKEAAQRQQQQSGPLRGASVASSGVSST